VLLSMTGYGEARHESDTLSVAVEVRALNNRYLKISIRATEPYNLLEPEVEKELRQRVRRGTIQVQLRVRRQGRPEDFRLNTTALRSYLEQLRPVQKELKLGSEVVLGHLLALPGVVPENADELPDVRQDWERIRPVLQEAVERFQNMRREEGQAMGQELLRLRQQLVSGLDEIRCRAPAVVEAYRDKLHERVRHLLQELDVEIDRSDLIKEVSIFAERSDIGEEIVRLASHLDQFQEILREPESPGRKLEFLTQEMFREANTIGSKANDVAIAQQVVKIKGEIERIRELIQNIE
jgi:uncharacterized protein (TIGR00255 family)